MIMLLTTFPTNESYWSSKVNKVRKSFVKRGGGGRKPRNYLTATAGEHKKLRKLEIRKLCKLKFTY